MPTVLKFIRLTSMFVLSLSLSLPRVFFLLSLSVLRSLSLSPVSLLTDNIILFDDGSANLPNLRAKLLSRGNLVSCRLSVASSSRIVYYFMLNRKFRKRSVLLIRASTSPHLYKSDYARYANRAGHNVRQACYQGCIISVRKKSR